MNEKQFCVYCIWGSHNFGGAFAYLIAQQSKKKVVLIDADILRPSVDLTLNVPKNPLSYEKQKSGMDLTIETIESNIFIPELFSEFSVIKRELPNLHIVTGVYDANEYEYIDINTIRKIIDFSKSCYDIIVLIVNDNPYDAITAYAFVIADQIIRCDTPTPFSIRYFNNVAVLFNEKKDIELSKFKFVASLKEGQRVETEYLKESTFGGYLGIVYDCDNIGCEKFIKRNKSGFGKVLFELGIKNDVSRGWNAGGLAYASNSIVK